MKVWADALEILDGELARIRHFLNLAGELLLRRVSCRSPNAPLVLTRPWSAPTEGGTRTSRNG